MSLSKISKSDSSSKVPTLPQFESLVLSSLKLMPTFDGYLLKQQDNAHFGTLSNPARFIDNYLLKAKLLDWQQIHITKYFQLCLRGRAENWYERRFRKLNLLQLSDEKEAERIWVDISGELIKEFEPKRNTKLLKEFYALEQGVSGEECDDFLYKLSSMIDAIEPELPESARVMIGMLKLKPETYRLLTTGGMYPTDYEDLVKKVMASEEGSNSNNRDEDNEEELLVDGVKQLKIVSPVKKTKKPKKKTNGKRNGSSRKQRIRQNIERKPLG